MFQILKQLSRHLVIFNPFRDAGYYSGHLIMLSDYMVHESLKYLKWYFVIWIVMLINLWSRFLVRGKFPCFHPVSPRGCKRQSAVCQKVWLLPLLPCYDRPFLSSSPLVSLYKAVRGNGSLHCFFTYGSVEAEGGCRNVRSSKIKCQCPNIKLAACSLSFYILLSSKLWTTLNSLLPPLELYT